MAQPTHVTISYRRQVQPAQYESEFAEMSGSFTVEDGENFEELAYDALSRARVQAHRVLGRPEPTIEPFSPAFEEAAYQITPEGEAALAEAVSRAGEKPKRKRRTKAEMEAARAAEAMAATESEFKERAAEEIDLMADAEPEPAKEITGEQLQAAAASKARALGANGAQAVKKLMAEYQVARLGELPQELRVEFIEQLEALKAT